MNARWETTPARWRCLILRVWNQYEWELVWGPGLHGCHSSRLQMRELRLRRVTTLPRGMARPPTPRPSKIRVWGRDELVSLGQASPATLSSAWTSPRPQPGGCGHTLLPAQTLRSRENCICLRTLEAGSLSVPPQALLSPGPGGPLRRPEWEPHGVTVLNAMSHLFALST